MLDNQDFDNYISLGYFCGIASDLEKMGLRNHSYPFDWVISPIQGVIKCLTSGFDKFLLPENMSQNMSNKSHYCDEAYEIYFFHDFNKFVSLDKQISKVKVKYLRRINRLMKDIKSPTLFIRYISSEEMLGETKSKELQWIEENINLINSIIKSFNSRNKIIFIGDDCLESESIEIYKVKKDPNSPVCRSPLYSNDSLKALFNTIQNPLKKHNLKRYRRKHFFSVIKKPYVKFCSIWQKLFMKEYCYSKTYNSDK